MVDGSGKRGILQFRILEVIQFQVMTVSRLFYSRWTAELNRGEFPQNR